MSTVEAITNPHRERARREPCAGGRLGIDARPGPRNEPDRGGLHVGPSQSQEASKRWSARRNVIRQVHRVPTLYPLFGNSLPEYQRVLLIRFD
jgi:hypothetical protein